MSYLVAAPRNMSDRNILDGALGCPVCRREYVISDGVVHFASRDTRDREITIDTSPYEALRCSALLDLQGNTGYSVLAGQWGALAHAMLDSVNVHLLLVNPPLPVKSSAGISILVTDSMETIAVQRARGIALDSESVQRLGMAAAAGAVESGGRIVAPVAFEVPADARMLAGDDRHWVAEISRPTIATVQLRRSRLPGI